MLSDTRQFDAALEIVGKLRAAGHEAYFAGGCVRDLLLGRPPKDFDVATSAEPDVVLGMFERTFAVGAQFGVVLVVAGGGGAGAAGGAEEQGEKPEFIVTEVATFRSDGAYSDGRHPDGVRYTNSAEEDVRRRDFTINGLLMDPGKLLEAGIFESHPSHKNKDVARMGHPAFIAEADVWAEARPGYGGNEEHQAEKQKQILRLTTPRLKSTPGAPFAQDDKPLSIARDDSLCVGELQEAGPSTSLRFAQDDKPLLIAQDDSSELIAQGDSPRGRGTLEQIVRCRDSLRPAVIDFVGGVGDLEAGMVRAIGRAEARFEEDRLRMLRAVRFAARFGFVIEEETKRAIEALAKRIESVSRERVRDELTKMLTEGHARRAFELLDETGLLAEVLPEIARMKGVEQPPEYHPEGDVWVHTLGLLGQLEEGCSATLAWGALLHDVGKPPTFRRAPDRVRFDGHVEVGVAMGEEICRRFRFSNEETRQILALIENHMRFAMADRMRASTLKRFFRLEGFEEHLSLHRMDCMAGSGNLDHWEFVRERWQAMPEETLRPKALLTGRELIAAGYKPGAGFKEMLRAVEDAQLEGVVGSEEEAMRMVRERFPLGEG
jgi:poly(A) polymerase